MNGRMWKKRLATRRRHERTMARTHERTMVRWHEYTTARQDFEREALNL